MHYTFLACTCSTAFSKQMSFPLATSKNLYYTELELLKISFRNTVMIDTRTAAVRRQQSSSNIYLWQEMVAFPVSKGYWMTAHTMILSRGSGCDVILQQRLCDLLTQWHTDLTWCHCHWPVSFLYYSSSYYTRHSDTDIIFIRCRLRLHVQ